MVREGGVSSPQKKDAEDHQGTRAARSPWRPSVTSLRCSPHTQVSRHLSKLFDSLCKLKFRLDADGRPLKVGLGMYSKEDEYMDFDLECDLSGQVGGRAGCGQRADTPPTPGHGRATCPQAGCHRRPVQPRSPRPLERMLQGLPSRTSSTAPRAVCPGEKTRERQGWGGGESSRAPLSFLHGFDGGHAHRPPSSTTGSESWPHGFDGPEGSPYRGWLVLPSCPGRHVGRPRGRTPGRPPAKY